MSDRTWQKARLLETMSKTKINTSLAAKGALANRLQRRTAGKIQNGHQGTPKWPTGSSTPKPFKQLSLNKFFDPSTPYRRKGRDGEEKKKGTKRREQNRGKKREKRYKIP